MSRGGSVIPRGAREPRLAGGPSLVRVAVVFSTLSLLGISAALAPALDPVTERLIRPFVGISGALIRCFGGNAQADGLILRNPSNGYSVQMVNGCNGIDVTILLWSAVLAFPASWKRKLAGMAAGGFALQSLNLVRLISLFYLRQLNDAWFEFAHAYLWQSLIVLDALVFFWVWVQRLSAAPRRSG